MTCDNVLDIGHDHDGWLSFYCTLEADHDGPHRGEFTNDDGRSVVITWRDANESAEQE